MSGGGPRPPNLVKYTSQTYLSLVLKRDPNWLRNSEEQVEYEFAKPRGGERLFLGFYKTRGPYAP